MTSRERLTLEGVLAAFDGHLRRTRGVGPGTRRNYARFVRKFLQSVRIWLSSPCVPNITARPSRTSTSKPTSPPKKQYYSGWPIPAPHRHDSVPATDSSPSCKTSDYAQLWRPPANWKPQPALASAHTHAAELHITAT
jgi:hypothetical protein